MNKDTSSEVHLDEFIMKLSDSGIRLYMKIDWNLWYDGHVKNLKNTKKLTRNYG